MEKYRFVNEKPKILMITTPFPSCIIRMVGHVPLSLSKPFSNLFSLPDLPYCALSLEKKEIMGLD